MDFEKQFKLEISNYSDDELIDIINGSLEVQSILCGFQRATRCKKTQKVKEKRKGNNPMVGATVACAVAVAEAL